MSAFNFDTIIDRRNTNSLKVDFNEENRVPEDVIPMWVADMDFETAPAIKEAIAQRVAHGVYGYTKPKVEYTQAIIKWMFARHGWDTKQEWYFYTPGVVFAIGMAIRGLTREGEAVLIQQPVYYPFSSIVQDNHRVLINNSLKFHKEDKRYEMDFERMENQIVENHVKVFLLCNPHNPIGRVWSKEELQCVGDICIKHGVIVISDEIHQDFIYEDFKHVPFASVRPEFEQISVTCTSPSKTFNLAGLQMSNIVVPNESLRAKITLEIKKTGYDEPNIFGMVACQAAYTSGEEWLNELNQYLQGNLDYLKNFLKEQLPVVEIIPPEGTYLVWLDFSQLDIEEEELDRRILYGSKLWLDPGKMFGEEGAGFQRLNIATPRVILKDALEALKRELLC